MVCPQSGPYGFTQGKENLPGGGQIGYVLCQGDAVAISLIQGLAFGYRIRIDTIGIPVD